MSRAELSIEISRLVARVLNGETIDTAASGKELAARFPDGGMSGEMIAEAITRAAGMVGMIRGEDAADAAEATAGAEEGAAAPLAGDDELVAVEAEMGELAAGEATGDLAHANGNGAAQADADESAGTGGSEKGIGTVIARGAAAVVRRAFFRG